MNGGVDKDIPYIAVSMVRLTMDHIPQHATPAGYSVRLFRDGDRETWLRIWRPAEQASGLSQITGEEFDKSFGPDLPAMGQRCYFLVAPDGRDVGTATAWYDHQYAGQSWGRVHWVAIVPEFQGRGLVKPLITVVMNRLRELGHARAVLGTQTSRLAAIRTYLDFGFIPHLREKGAADAWKLVRAAMRHPALVQAAEVQ